MEVTRHVRGRLADGMVIGAKVRARLFGMKVLELDADIAVSPSSERSRPIARASIESPRPAAIAARARTNGTVGGSLDGVARSIEASERELERARDRMP